MIEIANAVIFQNVLLLAMLVVTICVAPLWFSGALLVIAALVMIPEVGVRLVEAPIWSAALFLLFIVTPSAVAYSIGAIIDKSLFPSCKTKLLSHFLPLAVLGAICSGLFGESVFARWIGVLLDPQISYAPIIILRSVNAAVLAVAGVVAVALLAVSGSELAMQLILCSFKRGSALDVRCFRPLLLVLVFSVGFEVAVSFCCELLAIQV